MESQPVKQSSPLVLRKAVEDDLPVFYEQQLNPEANRMAAFTRRDPADMDGFYEHWKKIMADPAIQIMTILYHGRIAGYILTFILYDEREVGYWLGKDYWGKGIATAALQEFLTIITERPLYAHAAKDNTASVRVLQKCGFIITGEGRGFARARGEEIDEYILKLV